MARFNPTIALVLLFFAVVNCVDVAVFKTQQFIPQVVFQCGYRNRYFSKTGEWTTDKDPRANCFTGKLDILKYCRKVYHDLDITNIVEVSHYFQINNWCKIEGQPCKSSFWVKPYRCVVGEFESEALLVPENCHFGHVDDRAQCKDFDHWNLTAQSQCAKMTEVAKVQSFAMLEPCGLDMFSGVEYVCCPKDGVKKLTKQSLNVRVKLEDKKNGSKLFVADEDSDEDDDDDDEEEDEDVIDEDDGQATTTIKLNANKIMKQRLASSSTTTTTTTTTTAKSTKSSVTDKDDDDSDEDDEDSSEEQDPYFRMADLDREHDNYREALARLEKKHREKVAKVMKDWSELETKYQDMKDKDSKRAQQFRNDMTTRFQRTVAALEAETRDERRRLDEVHQQRVNAGFNERRRQTVKDYRDALSNRHPLARKVLHALQAFIRVEEKDRVHLLNRYRHLLRTDLELATDFRPDLLKKLVEMDTVINDTIAMLKMLPTLEQKVKPVALEFWQTFREEQTPDVDDDTILWIGDAINNEKILSFYEKQYKMDDKSNKSDKLEIAVDGFSTISPKKQAETKKKVGVVELKKVDINKQTAAALNPIVEKPKDDNQHYVDDVKLADSFALNDRLHHHMSYDEEILGPGSSSSNNGNSYYGFVVFGVAGVAVLAAMVLGVAMVRRRYSARGQGFIEVDACTPEERHVAGMQVNGYENPTYKYFDDKA